MRSPNGLRLSHSAGASEARGDAVGWKRGSGAVLLVHYINVCIAYYVIVLRAAPNGSRFNRREASRVLRVKAPGDRLLRDDWQVQRSRERRVVRHPHPAQTQ